MKTSFMFRILLFSSLLLSISVAQTKNLEVKHYEFAKGHNIFPGFYTLVVQDEIKNATKAEYKIWGLPPHENIPQYFFDLTLVHNNLNFDALYGGTTGIIEIENSCVLAPRMIEHWNYLVFLGVESELAFEPIHSPQFDLFFKKINRISTM